MLVADAIQAGFREGNVIDLGATPSDAEIAEGLQILNGFRRTVLGYEFGENLQDWPIPPPPGMTCPYEGAVYLQQSPWWLGPYQNRRLLLKLTDATTIFFPNNPDCGARMSIVDVGSSTVELTLNGNGRLIEGNATLSVDSPTQLNHVTWFYRADLASWERQAEIAAGDASFPIEDDFDELWIAYLAIRVSPRNSTEPSAVIQAIYKNALSRAKARYRQTENVGVTFRTTGVSIQAFPDGMTDWLGQ